MKKTTNVEGDHSTDVGEFEAPGKFLTWAVNVAHSESSLQVLSHRPRRHLLPPLLTSELNMTKTMGTSHLPEMDPSCMPSVTAREMMVRNLITLLPTMDALEALDVLLRNRISGAPVVNEDGKFIGIFSEKSCMRFVVSMAYDGMPSTEVVSLVDADPPTITEETDLLTITQTFLTESCRRLPVLDNDGRLRGQISRRDVMRAVRSHLNAPKKSARQSGLFFSALLSSEERRV